MNSLNAFVSVNKMNTNEILAQRFYRFFKYTRNIALISFIVFFILNAINTGNSILYWICYGCLMISIVGAMQSVLLYVLSKFFFFKKYYKNKG